MADPMRAPDAAQAGGIVEDLAHLKTACSLPGTLLRVLEVIADERSNNRRLAGVIEGDPDLCERVLRVANSSLYLTYNDRIDEAILRVTNLPTAVLKLGFSGVRNIAFTQGLSEMARGGHEMGIGIAVHLLVVAELARSLGRRRTRTLGEDAYFCGLMHDFGKLALLRTLPLDYLRIAARCQLRGVPALQAENALLRPAQPVLENHVVSGAGLLRAHGLPEEVAEVVERHHDDPVRHTSGDHAWTLPGLVIIANQLAYAAGYPDGIGEENSAYLAQQELGRILGLDEAAVAEVLRESAQRAATAVTASRLPVKPELLSRLSEMGAADEAGMPASPQSAGEPYGIYLTIIDLARSRPRVGFYDFKAHTGLTSAALQHYLGELARHDYLQSIDGAAAHSSYQATRRMHGERPQDILRRVAMDGQSPQGEG